MVDGQRKISLPREERPFDFTDFQYSPKITPDQLFENIQVHLALTFGRKDPFSCSGSSYQIKSNDRPELEARSFYEAAQKAWERYEKSVGEFEFMRDFTKQKLTEKWTELNGEKLTGQKLELK